MTSIDKARAIIAGWLDLCKQENTLNGMDTLTELIANGLEAEKNLKLAPIFDAEKAWLDYQLRTGGRDSCPGGGDSSSSDDGPMVPGGIRS